VTGEDEDQHTRLSDSGERFVRSTAVMSVGTALSRLTGLIRVSATAFAIGAASSRLADAYGVANNTPNIVYELVLGGVLTSVFVPVFVGWLEKRGREQAWNAARVVLSIGTVALLVFTLVCILAAPWIVRLYTVGLPPGPQSDAERAAATFFLRWFMPQIVFYGIGAVASGLLNAHRRFAAPMFAPILNNLIVIGTMFLFAALPGAPASPTPGNITTAQRYVLAVGTTLGVVAMTMALWPALRRTGFRFRWRLDIHHEVVRRIGSLGMWVFVYVLANQLGLLVVFALGLKAENYAAYLNAFIIFQLPHAIFAVSIMTALLPALSSRWARRDTDGFRVMVARGIRSTGFVLIPAALGYIVLASPIALLLLAHGVTTPADADIVAKVLVFFSIGLFSFSAFQLLLRAFYAMQDTRTPALINVAAVAVNTVANFVFFHFLGVKGLALGHATAYTFAAVTAALVMRKRLGGLEGAMLASGLARIAVAAGVTAIAAWLASQGLAGIVNEATIAGQLIRVLGAVAVGLLVFGAMALALRLEDLALIRDVLARRFRR